MTTIDQQPRLKEVLTRVLTIALSSLIVAVNLKSFVAAGDLFPGGFTGVARLIQRCALEFGGVELPFGPINLALNAVPIFISFKFIGRKFTLYSCLMIFLGGMLTDIIPSYTVTTDTLLVAVFGGLLNAVAIAVCLMANATSGGTDFIAIFLSEKFDIDSWNYIFCGNVVMLLVAGYLFGWDRALYSMLFQYAHTQVVRMLDPDGRRATLLIVTGRESAGGVCAQIQDTNHSATLIEGVGLYNGEPCVMIYSVVEDSQLRSLTRKVRQSDPKAFVNVLRTERVVGKFYRRPRD